MKHFTIVFLGTEREIEKQRNVFEQALIKLLQQEMNNAGSACPVDLIVHEVH
jgi:hypothetical protein